MWELVVAHKAVTLAAMGLLTSAALWAGVRRWVQRLEQADSRERERRERWLRYHKKLAALQAEADRIKKDLS